MSIGARPPAEEISQNLLDITGKALMERDFEAFMPHFTLPYGVRTMEAHFTLTKQSQMHDLFVDVCNAHDVKGVTQMVRKSVSARYKTGSLIEATHDCFLMRDAELIVDPYPGFSTLKFNGYRWQVASTEYAFASGSILAQVFADRDAPGGISA